MATTNTWEEVVEKISGVVNRGVFSKTFTPTTSSQSASGGAGYYSSVSTTCNSVSLSGNAGIAQVLTGYTFYNTSLTKQTGTMVNRGTLNWNPTGSTAYTVSAGYYSGGTLNSSGAYNAGYNAGANAIRTVKSISTTATSASGKMNFVDWDNSGDLNGSCYVVISNPGLTSSLLTAINWSCNGRYYLVACSGSINNISFFTTVHHLAALADSAKNLVPVYSGGLFYLPVYYASKSVSITFLYV